ncbi:MAG: YfcC family protein [Bacteroidales bacterium]|nr:YfcC family protein [Bacteroidales bacterium]
MTNSKLKIPGTFTIVFCIVIMAAVATWLVPGGEFVRTRQVVDGVAREVVVPNSYHAVDSHWQTWQIFSAFFNGFVRTSNIIVFIFMIGGAFWIFNHTKAIDAGVQMFLSKMQGWQQKKVFRHINVNYLVIASVMLVFSLFGAVFGMSEETIAFVIIFVPLSISMGYDALVGVAMCYLAAHVGFAGAVFNPFTIGIAQGLAGLPSFSGFEYRIICWLVFTASGIAFTLWYASVIHRNPERSPLFGLNDYWRAHAMERQEQSIQMEKSGRPAWVLWIVLSVIFVVLSCYYTFTDITVSHLTVSCPVIPVLTGLFVVTGFFALRKNVHMFILTLLLFTIFALIVGVLGYQWYVEEIATLFLIMGICAGIAYACNMDKICSLFLEGCKDIMSAALIVGLAGGIIVILQDGRVIDTMLYGISQSMQHASNEAALAIMYAFQNVLNLMIPSGSAKAALTIPIMSEFADMLHIARQTMVLAFQFGDGITNMITPASGVLIGCLGAAKIPYSLWVKWIWKFVVFLFILGFVLLLPTLYISLNGF